MPLGKLHFLHTLCLVNEEQTSRKKIRSNVSKVKRSPLAKIQLFLNTFKNGQKTKGTFLPAALHLFLYAIELSKDNCDVDVKSNLLLE